mgnify:CR=1 FL=1
MKSKFSLATVCATGRAHGCTHARSTAPPAAPRHRVRLGVIMLTTICSHSDATRTADGSFTSPQVLIIGPQLPNLNHTGCAARTKRHPP